MNYCILAKVDENKYAPLFLQRIQRVFTQFGPKADEKHPDASNHKEILRSVYKKSPIQSEGISQSLDKVTQVKYSFKSLS